MYDIYCILEEVVRLVKYNCFWTPYKWTCRTETVHNNYLNPKLDTKFGQPYK
jgi:hypothetical protein